MGTRRNPATVLLIGYYGKGNAGDEWLKEKTITLIKKAWPSSGISESKREFFKADCIVYGGGGLFQNKTSNRSLVYYCFWVLLAWLLRKPVYMIGQGIGPISGTFWNKLTRFTLKKAHAISVRDEASYAYVTHGRGKNPKCILTTDLAFYDSHFSKNPHHSAPTDILLNLRPWPHAAKQWPHLSAFLLKNAHLFLSCSPEDTLLKSHLPHTGLLALIHNKNSEISQNPPIIVSMRFHACVWAALHGIPFLALVYDDKVEHLAKSLHQPTLSVSSETVSVEDIQAMLNTLIANYSHYQDQLQKTVPELIRYATRHEDVLNA